MSKWTHVNGSIRLDAIRPAGIPRTEANLGVQSHWGDDHESVDIPNGSEGSLTWTKWTSPDASSMAAYTVTIFGDLRDYDCIEGIKKYLNQIIEGQMVRSGVCEVSIEGEGTWVFAYDNATEAWLEIYKVEA